MTGTYLLLEGAAPETVTAAFLTDLMDLADDRGLEVEGISVLDNGADDCPAASEGT